MARPLRIEFPGAIYHVTSREDRREPIFEDDTDRDAVLGRTLPRFDGCALAYCLMDNHYHLVPHTRPANLSSIMRDVNGIYTQAYKHRHGSVGHLFQGRFKAIVVDRDAYLLEVCRYAELNPVRVSGPGRSRDEGIARAHREGSYSLSAIAREVGLSVPRVSRIVAAHVECSQPKGKTPMISVGG